MDELIQQAAEQLGYPAEMVERSARARAQADGTTPEAVLAAWVGAEAPPAAPASGDVPAAAPAPAAAAPAPVAEAPSGPAFEVLEPEPGAPQAPPPPEEIEEEDEEERAASVVPRWLAAAFLVIPLVAVLYGLNVPNGPSCGSGAVLAVDPVTGESVNCDGSAYGAAGVDFVSIGAEAYASCGACHGATGGGVGNFPGFINGELLATFPVGDCAAHVDWVKLGSLNWPEATYGANAKPVGGSGAQMPGFEGQAGWDDLRIRAVVLYERVAFGDVDIAEAEADCGLVAGEGEMAAAAP